VIWQEPVSAVYTSNEQAKLEGELEDLESAERERERSRAARERRRESGRRRKVARRRLSDRAKDLRGYVDQGEPLGRLSIGKLDVKDFFVSGTGDESLRKGPSHYLQTGLPGERRTVGIAGHRTTYSAPFRNVDDLDRGDEIVVRMPYGRFAYGVEKVQIVQPEQVDVLDSKGYERLVLTACHPLYSAAQRIVVFARLRQSTSGAIPLGAFTDDDDFGPAIDPGGEFADGPVLVFIVLGLMAAIVGVVASSAALAQEGPGARSNEVVLSLAGSLIAAVGLMLVFFGLIP